MKAEKATHLALLLGRLRSSYRKQILLVEEIENLPEDFALGWQCARQEEVLIRALRALNEFFRNENLPGLPEERSDGESLAAWKRTLREREQSIAEAYRVMQAEGLRSEMSPEELFPELGEIS